MFMKNTQCEQLGCSFTQRVRKRILKEAQRSWPFSGPGFTIDLTASVALMRKGKNYGRPCEKSFCGGRPPRPPLLVLRFGCACLSIYCREKLASAPCVTHRNWIDIAGAGTISKKHYSIRHFLQVERKFLNSYFSPSFGVMKEVRFWSTRVLDGLRGFSVSSRDLWIGRV
jgi:hypothetical protein